MRWDYVAVGKRGAIAYREADPLNRPVKVTSLVRPLTLWSEGFVTCRKFVAGCTLDEVERMPGLPAGELCAGPYLYEFMRLPKEDEFELKGYTQCPDGKPWTPDSKYPPGLGAAPMTNRQRQFHPQPAGGDRRARIEVSLTASRRRARASAGPAALPRW